MIHRELHSPLVKNSDLQTSESEPLSSFLVVTTHSVSVVYQNKSPEELALKFGNNEMLQETIDVCLSLRINNLKPICNFLATETVKRGKFEFALKVFETSQTPLSMQLDLFCEHGALDSCFDYFRQIFLNREYPG